MSASNRIDAALGKLKADGTRAFIPYIAAGDPSLSVTEELVLAFDAAGADVVELGIPFSDPIADGPSIQRATERALAAGVTVDGIFRMVERIRRSSDIPIAFMTYYNPIFYFGVAEFCATCKQIGIDGLIVPDLTPEDADELIPAAREHDLAAIFMVAPTSTDDRMKMIAELSTGFIYGVSLTGVTGARDTISIDLTPMLDKLRGYTNKPVCVGFGVGNAQQARDVAARCDGVIVGSAIVNTIEANLKTPEKIVPATKAFVEELVAAVRSV